MNIYLVQCNIAGSHPDKILIKASNKKEAIDYVWKNYYIEENEKIDTSRGFEYFRKKDLYAININELFNDEIMVKI